MKTLRFSVFFSLIALVAFCLSGCSKDNDNDPDSPSSSGSDYIVINVNGKEYTAKPNSNYYVQYDPVGYENEDTPLTLTWNGQDMFYKNGFEFLYGLVHYSNKSKLKNSAKTSYIVANYDDYINFYNNLTFVPDFVVDDVDGVLQGGTHSVQNIKQVGNNIVVTGSFDCKMDVDGEYYRISGKYQMTIPFY